LKYLMRGALLILVVSCVPRPSAAQELGNKLLGAIGIDAGAQPPPGLYVVDRLVIYRADRLLDRNGDRLPVESLGIDVVANAIGVSWTRAIANRTYFTAALGAPLAHIAVNADHPVIAVDASGFGDLVVQPVRLGWRLERFDVVAGYTAYVPTGSFEPRRLSVGRGFWTDQLSLGGAFHADRARLRRASLLVSYDVNRRKRDIDIRRGNTVQVQGGVGTRVAGPVDAGLAGFALWQVTDNRGADLPGAVRDARTRAFGIGPEVGMILRTLRTRLTLRAERELGVRSRQEGWIVVFGAAFLACCFEAPH